MEATSSVSYYVIMFTTHNPVSRLLSATCRMDGSLIVANHPGTSGTVPDFVPLFQMAYCTGILTRIRSSWAWPDLSAEYAILWSGHVTLILSAILPICKTVP